MIEFYLFTRLEEMMNSHKLAAMLSLCAGLGLASTAFSAPISEQEWTFARGAVQMESDWLSLTRSNEHQTTSHIQSKKTYAPGQVIHVEFDYVSWGDKDRGADGLSLYLFDAGVPNAGTGGAPGGGLGYCRQVGAYLGIGFDEYGTFASSWCENGRRDRVPSTDTVTIRGSQAGGYKSAGVFPIKEGGLACKAKCGTRQQAIDTVGIKHIVADLIPKNSGPGYNVNVAIDGKMIVSGVNYPFPAPAAMKIGIAAANGDYTQHHEIRNLQAGIVGEDCPPDGPPEGPVNLAKGVPAFLTTYKGAFPYLLLNDGDRMQKGYDGAGPWGKIGSPTAYGLDFPSSTAMNTIVIYFQSGDGSDKEPSDSTEFINYPAVAMRLDVSEDNAKTWTTLLRVPHSKLAKQTVTLKESKRLTNLLVVVEGGTPGPVGVELEVFNK